MARTLTIGDNNDTGNLPASEVPHLQGGSDIMEVIREHITPPEYKVIVGQGRSQKTSNMLLPRRY